MLEFLKGKNKSFVGIDFATSSIKVVELSRKDQHAYLENYGIVDLNFSGRQNDSIKSSSSYDQKINEALKKLIEQMKLKHRSPAYVSIPGFSGLITIIELPDMAQNELTNAIQFEAHKYIPTSLDEVVMSWEIIEHIDGNRIKVLLVAAPKKEIEHHDNLVAGANLEVNAIELETFSIARSLVGDDPGIFFIIDIGARSTNMILVEKSVIRVNRNIDAGGNEITMAISDSMGISKQRAEIFKKGTKDLLNNRESALTMPVLELIVGESKRILNAYKEKNRDGRIDGILLSGGTSKMQGIAEYFTRLLGMPVTTGNPWRRISTKEEVAPLVKDLGPSFSVAVGLALRGLEEHERE